MTASAPIAFDVFFDYQCPFVYRAAGLIDAVRRSGRRDIDVRWRYFSLTQVNSKDDGWTVWGASASDNVRGRLAFGAAEAARRQGRFADLHQPLLVARHRDRLDLDQVAVVEQVAAESGLDVERFRRDLADPRIYDALARDHSEAVSELGVFGTPTLVFADGASAYVRLSEPVEGEGAVEVFDRLLSVAASEPRILEIKRPRRPVPV
ncbi:MAG TPA: DsbA family protein [Candidatus Dormibacteraeota bacterium]|nr:DsbA family protein [Candidatus Dormibacteraeota bacterium]